MYSRLGGSAIALFIAVGLVSCGGDSSGPSGPKYPPLNASVVATLCIRGNLSVGKKSSGSVTATDCDDTNWGTYFETWRIRVTKPRTVTFTASAPGFDAVMDVDEIIISDGDIVDATYIDGDDDTIGDDPRVIVDLLPDHDYIVVVYGYDYSETGTYDLFVE
jgi:hypothetical protein